jgi:2-keto-4-pentenoate hydratase/2-oxohepta-3-ene-1,7-dioic acid hydratase in catechol pathway
MSSIDETHDPRRASWVASAQGHAEFPIQNLPFGVFSPADGSPRGGVAIGDQIFDLRAGLEAGLFSGEAARAAEAAAGASLNPLMASGKNARLALRRRLSALLSADGPDRAKIEPLAAQLLHNAADCTLHLPAMIGSFTDFFAGIHHARNGGMRRDPNNPLNPNYKYVPVAYHSRASSVRPSGVPIRRPSGQRKAINQDAPTFGPAQKLDYELELAVWVGPGNELGEPIPIAEAGDHVFDRGARPVSGRAAAAAGRGSAAAAISLGRGRPADRSLRHRARSLAADRRPAGEGPATAPDVRQQHYRPLLDPRPTGRAPHLRRLQSRCRRSVRHRHDLRADAGGLWQPNGAERRRPAADSARLGGNPYLPGERRRGDLPRPLPKSRLHADRLWRVPRPRSVGAPASTPSTRCPTFESKPIGAVLCTYFIR